MNSLRKRVLGHLERLVAVDTTNPPREISADGGIFDVIRRALGPTFHVEMTDLGDGCVSLLAVRGSPRLLFNFHVDTVPAADAYSSDPLALRVESERAIGLGACDIKGAAAAMLAALDDLPNVDAALLFTSDEEAGSSRCVRAFCAGDGLDGVDGVLVAEPTECRAVLDHRGIATATAVFRGTSGHASSGRASEDSALHHAVQWSHQALTHAELEEAQTVGGLRGICFNLGRIEGGKKPNMIADHASVSFGFRPLPGGGHHALMGSLSALAEGLDAELTEGFVAPSLPASAAQRLRSLRLVDECGLELGEPVSFWTEAALFASAGTPAWVFGPGSIAQAHTADEWVAIEQLERASALYARVLGRATAGASDRQ